MAAVQVGVPLSVFVTAEGGAFRYVANPGYEPACLGRVPAVVRFINAEGRNPRYYLVEVWPQVRAWYDEFGTGSGPLTLTRHESVGPHLVLQTEAETLSGRPPPARGEEYRLKISP